MKSKHPEANESELKGDAEISKAVMKQKQVFTTRWYGTQSIYILTSEILGNM